MPNEKPTGDIAIASSAGYLASVRIDEPDADGDPQDGRTFFLPYTNRAVCHLILQRRLHDLGIGKHDITWQWIPSTAAIPPTAAIETLTIAVTSNLTAPPPPTVHTWFCVYEEYDDELCGTLRSSTTCHVRAATAAEAIEKADIVLENILPSLPARHRSFSVKRV